MKRKIRLVRPRRKGGKVEIAVDVEHMPEIFQYIGQSRRHKNKFLDIVAVIMEELHNRHLYRREDINKEARNVHAMRFFVGQENDRIYCKEFNSIDRQTGELVRVVVMCELHLHKTSQSLSENELAIINKIAGYEFEYEKQ